jgi:hypothetical protein
MATWKYGPIEVDEDWGIEWKKARYSLEYSTVSDTMSVIRECDGIVSSDLMGQEPAVAVGRMLAQWLVGFKGNQEVEFLRELVKNHDELYGKK